MDTSKIQSEQFFLMQTQKLLGLFVCMVKG